MQRGNVSPADLVPESPIDALRAHLAPLQDLKSAAAVLEWDEEVYLPSGALAARAQQTATLRHLAHVQFTAPETGRLIDAAANVAETEDDRALVNLVRRDYDRAIRIPATLVHAFAEASAHARKAWQAAREARSFAGFAPALGTLLDLSRQKARAIDANAPIYDVLMDEFEPGARTEDVERLFGDVQRALAPLAASAASRPPDASCLYGNFPEAQQWAFCTRVLADLGFSFDHGRLDASAHPFTTTFHPTDVRLTTRIQPDYFPSAFYGALHEAGHGLYEQGIDLKWARTPLAEGTSLGVHESQSRLYENLVGRHPAFWAHYFPLLQETFPDAVRGVSVEQWHRALHLVQPSLIRVEADEVTYPLHISVRFSIERALLEERLALDDLPAAWNDAYEALLGVRPAHDGEGVLQDIHWALGAFGYFPTYTLGSIMAAQLFEAYERDGGSAAAAFSSGHFTPLRDWLRTHIHQYGRSRSAAHLVLDATGEALSADAYLRDLRARYSASATL